MITNYTSGSLCKAQLGSNPAAETKLPRARRLLAQIYDLSRRYNSVW